MFKKISMYLGVAVAGVVALAKNVYAAADPDLVAGLASSTAIITDNKGTIIVWVAGLVGVSTLIALAIRAFFFGKRQVVGSIPGGRRKR